MEEDEKEKPLPAVIVRDERGNIIKAIPTEDALQEVRSKISWHLDQISRFFVPGNHITIIIRTPVIERGELVMTDEEPHDLPRVIKAIEDLKKDIENEKASKARLN